jgi:hypothetical protein
MQNLPDITARASVKKGFEVVMARGQQDLDLTDLKMFNFLLFKSYRQLNDRNIHKVPVSDVLGFLNHNSVSKLEKSLKNLGNVKIDIDYQDGGVDHSVSCHFLSFDVSKAEDGMLNFAFDPILLKFLFEPKVYSRINMKFLSQFKTIYGAKLFEIMTLFQHRYHRTWKVSVAELRSSLGVSEEQYSRFDNLKKAVIEKAVDEVNQFATFGLSVDYIKGGRGGRVVEVRISVIPRSEVQLSEGPKSKARDPDTIDILSGQTDAEQSEAPILLENTINQAIDIMMAANIEPDVQGMIDKWVSSTDLYQITEVDLSFLRWLSFEVQKDDFDLIEDDVIGSILADFD